VVQHVDTVHPDGSSLEFVNSLQGTVDVLGEDGSRKTVKGVVGLADNIVLVLEFDDNSDGPEDLLLNDLHLWLGPREDRWLNGSYEPMSPNSNVTQRGVRRGAYLDVVTLVSNTATAEVNVCALLLPGLDIRHDTLE
jgi:hypothetical protein